MKIKKWYRFWVNSVKEATPLEREKVFKEFPMQPPADQIYYINIKAEPKVEAVNLTINLKHKKTLENE